MSGQHPETLRIAFLRALKEKLHPQTNAECRLPELANHLIEPALAQLRHRRRRRTHARQDHVRSHLYALPVERHRGLRSQSLQGKLQRGEIGTRADDGHAHSTPFVLGSSVPSSRIACRRLRPTPLKHASIMW